jgi:hypothetical protein
MSRRKNFETGSEAHETTYPIDTVGTLSRDKAAEP